MKKLIFASVLICSMLLAAPASADWDVGDGHKMHFPQLPDPNGWDVRVTNTTLADDFKCGQAGLITDVHFWASWRRDEIPSDANPNGLQGIVDIGLTIYDNIPEDPADANDYSQPGDSLWGYQTGRNFTVRPTAEPAPQGWYDPFYEDFRERMANEPHTYLPPAYTVNDHNHYFQYNIDIPEACAFEQQEGNIYWLGIDVILDGNIIASQFQLGWKTSTSQWEDDAVYLAEYWDGNIVSGYGWEELRDPVTGESMDLAFVITPEPATLAVLGLGGVVMLRRRRRRGLA